MVRRAKTGARLAGIVARMVHGLGADTPGPAGLARAYRGRMPSAATAVDLYDKRDSGEERHLELLARLEPVTGSGKSSRLTVILSGINVPHWR